MNATANAAADNATKPQRDAQGRFLPGNDGGPGNPFGRHLARARVEWNSKATPEHVENVYNVVYEKACEGCAWAVKLYLLYLLGKPKEMVNPDLADIEEWELYARATNMQKANPDVMNSPDHRFGLEVARTLRPVMAEEARKEMQEGLKEMEENEREMTRVEDEYEREMELRAKRKAKGGKRKVSGKRLAGAKRDATAQTQESARTVPLPDGFFQQPDTESRSADQAGRRSADPGHPSLNGVFGAGREYSDLGDPSLNGVFGERDPKLTDR